MDLIELEKLSQLENFGKYSLILVTKNIDVDTPKIKGFLTLSVPQLEMSVFVEKRTFMIKKLVWA